MERIRFILPQVKTFPDERPDACEYCGSPILTKHGTADKTVKDLHVEKVTTVRYRCSDCGRTFRHYPPGIDRSGQTQRMRGWAALAWALGLSLRSASHLLAAFGVSISRMSARRDVQEAGRNARKKQAGRTRGHMTVVGADETVVRVKGEKAVVGVVTDAATGEVLGRAGQARFGRLHGLASGFRERLRSRGDGRGRPEYVQARRPSSGSGSSDLLGSR